MAVGLFITILLLFHQISSSIQESVQVDPSTSPNDRDEILYRDRRTLNKKDCPDTVRLGACRRNLNETEQELIEARGKICGLEAEIECEQKERSDEFTKINSKISQSDDRSTKIGAELKAEIDSKVGEMSRIISVLKADFARERNETKDKDVEMSRLTAKMAEIEANFMGKIAETKRKEADLEAQLRAQNTEVRDGKAKIGELEGKIKALQGKNSYLETQINRTMNLLDYYGWSYLPKTASWYKLIEKLMTFDQAEAYCASRKGSHLVSIHSYEENEFILGLVAISTAYELWYWIGLKRNPNKGNAFEWTDGSSVDFTNWAPHWDGPNAFIWSNEWPWGRGPPEFTRYFICKRHSF